MGEDFKPGVVTDCNSSAVKSAARQNYTISPDLFTLSSSPINIEALRQELDGYHSSKALAILEGFTLGFPLHYSGLHSPSDSKNLKSALGNPDIVREKIQAEVTAGRVAGPFISRPIPTLRISPLGLVPKKEPNQFRLIHHLSFPSGHSVNDFIDPKLCSVQYTSFDEAVHMIQDLGQGCLLGKSDVRRAFRILPVSLSEIDQLGFMFDGMFYVDKAMPFGCSISCQTWELFATFLEFCVRRASPCGSLLHYLDDFLFGGKKDTNDCTFIMSVFMDKMQLLGVPIASDKTEGPTTKLSFLGLELDSEEMTIRIPMGKIEEIRQKIVSMLARKKCTLREMQSLIGSLNFACRAVVPGRPFCRRLINAICGLTKPHHHLNITLAMKEDLQLWLNFFTEFNGISVFHDRYWVSNEDVQLFTDSAGGADLGFGAYFAGKWTCAHWPQWWIDQGITADITVLEMFPLLVCLHIWGQELKNKKIVFRSDNLSSVHIINSMTSKNDEVMIILRAITLLCLQLNIAFKALHVRGCFNRLADTLSRFQLQKFHELAPDADPEPSTVPNHLWNIFKQVSTSC